MSRDFGQSPFIQIVVGNSGTLYALDSSGRIWWFSSDGNKWVGFPNERA